MPLHHIIILALIQGLTEFLPVSSSGHLVLAHAVFQRGAETINYWGTNLGMDIAVHLGTLLAVILYFRRDIAAMLGGARDIALSRRVETPGARMLAFVALGSVPVVVAGYMLHVMEPDWARSLPVLAWGMIVFGVVMGVADKYGPQHKSVETMGWRDAAWIGLAQALALIPGVSRAGITMTAARFLGFSRVESARYSFFLAIVAIAGAGALGCFSPDGRITADMIPGVAVGVVVACVSALAAMHVLLRWLQHAGLMVFVWYRVLFGILLLGLIHTGILV